MLADIVLVLGS